MTLCSRPVRSLILSFFCVLAACAPTIGDSCDNSGNCSINLDRFCDRAQPGGYCTILNCQADQCPDDAVCIRFRDDSPRLSVVACMKSCSGNGDCRDDYVCMGASQLEAGELGGQPLSVEVVDLDRDPETRFCVATLPDS